MNRKQILAPVAHILENPKKDWRQITTFSRGNIRVAFRQLDVDWKKFNQQDFLFAHVTILASCKVEDNGYRIVEPCDELVNANGNAWTNEVIQHCYKTFIGGSVFQNHVQIPSLEKGKILDAVLRPVTHKGKNGKEADVFYVDLLTATSRKHEDLVEKIESGKLTTLSMGTVANTCVCSICGKMIGDDDKNCKHLENNIGQYVEVDGKPYKCAELIGAIDQKTGEYVPDSCHFIEASWVDHPAFAGAVVNELLNSQQEIRVSKQKDREAQLNELTEDMFMNLRVADRQSQMALNIAKEQYFVKKSALNILK